MIWQSIVVHGLAGFLLILAILAAGSSGSCFRDDPQSGGILLGLSLVLAGVAFTLQVGAP